VRLVEKEGTDKQQSHQTQDAVHHGRLAQPPVVRAHQDKHAGQPDGKPGCLAQQENVRVAVFVFSRDRRRAEDHHRAQQAQRQRHDKEPAVILEPSRH
jgi:hypothetical protein